MPTDTAPYMFLKNSFIANCYKTETKNFTDETIKTFKGYKPSVG